MLILIFELEIWLLRKCSFQLAGTSVFSSWNVGNFICDGQILHVLSAICFNYACLGVMLYLVWDVFIICFDYWIAVGGFICVLKLCMQLENEPGKPERDSRDKGLAH